MSDTSMELVDIAVEEYGYDDVMDMLEDFILDSVVPGVCTECHAIGDVEPDQDRGHCEMCGKNTVKSIHMLMGII